MSGSVLSGKSQTFECFEYFLMHNSRRKTPYAVTRQILFPLIMWINQLQC